MAQVMVDNLPQEHLCDFCRKIYKSPAGLMAHMNRKHPLDSPNGLTCYTCNKLFTQRDLIENHFKTVKHQLECRKLQKLDLVENTGQDEGIRRYIRRLLERNDFTVTKYQPRTWDIETTVEIPLESITPLQDPRKHTCKHPLDTQNTEEPVLKTCKTTEESQPSTTRSTLNEDSTRKTQQNATSEI